MMMSYGRVCLVEIILGDYFVMQPDFSTGRGNFRIGEDLVIRDLFLKSSLIRGFEGTIDPLIREIFGVAGLWIHLQGRLISDEESLRKFGEFRIEVEDGNLIVKVPLILFQDREGRKFSHGWENKKYSYQGDSIGYVRVSFINQKMVPDYSTIFVPGYLGRQLATK